MKKIKVTLDKQSLVSHEICIGHAILDRIGLVIAKGKLAHHYTIISDSNVSALYGKEFLDVLKEVHVKADLVEFPAGESSKNMDTVLTIAKELLGRGVDRSSALIALGGGVTGDITGFLASIYMRGIPCIQVPTTLMAQVDSSIGGKTGVDLPEGKNLLGTFSQPQAIFIDLRFLETLSEDEFTNGLSEVVKYGIIDDTELFTLLEGKSDAIRDRNPDALQSIVERSCKIKKGIVEIDETDMGIRRILNFGHTVGHAVEAASGYMIPHGNAVSVGMIAAARVSEKMKYLSSGDRSKIQDVIRSTGLADRIPASLDTGEIISKLGKDKKKRGEVVHFVLLKKIGMPFINGSVDETLIRETIEELKQ
jgi:3-dehydroquinate synthase